MSEFKDYTIKTYDAEGAELSNDVRQWSTDATDIETNCKSTLRSNVSAVKLEVFDGNTPVAEYEKLETGQINKVAA